MISNRLSPEEQAAALKDSLRTFRVTVLSPDDAVLSYDVHAHTHNAGQDGQDGHMCFVTVDAGGRSLITHVVHASMWLQVDDVTPEEMRARAAKHSALSLDRKARIARNPRQRQDDGTLAPYTVN